MNQLIVMLTGRICAGKSTISNRLEHSYNAKILRSSDVLSVALAAFDRDELSRDDYAALAVWAHEHWGRDVLVRARFRDIDEYFKQHAPTGPQRMIGRNHALLVIEGFRNPDEVTAIRERFPRVHVHVLSVEAEFEVRRERYRERGRPIDDTSTHRRLSFEEVDGGIGEQHLDECAPVIDHTILNNWGIPELVAKIDAYASSLGITYARKE